jgi:hypothetical protein
MGNRGRDLTCPICGYVFETEAQREAHVPCPEPGTERTRRESEPLDRTLDRMRGRGELDPDWWRMS